MVNPTIYWRILLAVPSIWADDHPKDTSLRRRALNRPAVLTTGPFDIPCWFPRVNQLCGIPGLRSVTMQRALQTLKYVPRKDQPVAYEHVELGNFCELRPSSKPLEV
jgi:hypothetical protein